MLNCLVETLYKLCFEASYTNKVFIIIFTITPRLHLCQLGHTSAPATLN